MLCCYAEIDTDASQVRVKVGADALQDTAAQQVMQHTAGELRQCSGWLAAQAGRAVFSRERKHFSSCRAAHSQQRINQQSCNGNAAAALHHWQNIQ
jgi:hypothetical protein